MNATVSNQNTAVYIQTHGCKLNQADSAELANQFVDSGFVITDSIDDADIYLINTCTVTHVADRKARQAIRSVRKKRPDCKIVVTGCYAERSGEDLKKFPEIDLIIGNKGKNTLVRYLEECAGENFSPCATGSDFSQVLMPRISRTRGMVKIQEGCDQVCAYCIVPRVRGRERSIYPDILVNQIKNFVDTGYKEVVLTGTQLGSYGFEFKEFDLTLLLQRILNETDLQRLRVSSLQPQDIDQRILSVCEDDRFCPHFHLPLQSGSDSILGRMRRRYKSKDYLESVNLIRNQIPDVSITADVIVGFPGETDDDFEATYDLCNEIGFSSVHVFPYSVRPGTSAQYFNHKVESDVKSIRTKRLIELSKDHEKLFRQDSIGKIRPVLWEASTKVGSHVRWTGLTDNYLRVGCNSNRQLYNKITPVKITSFDGQKLLGEILDNGRSAF